MENVDEKINISFILPVCVLCFLVSGFASPLPAMLVSSSSGPVTITTAPTDTPVPATPSPSAGDTQTNVLDGMVMVYVPAGDFTMGFDRPAKKDMAPGHTVTLDSFGIDRTEVTNGQYAKCVNDGACVEPQ